jgi:hypothetical protein
MLYTCCVDQVTTIHHSVRLTSHVISRRWIEGRMVRHWHTRLLRYRLNIVLTDFVVLKILDPRQNSTANQFIILV